MTFVPMATITKPTELSRLNYIVQTFNGPSYRSHLTLTGISNFYSCILERQRFHENVTYNSSVP